MGTEKCVHGACQRFTVEVKLPAAVLATADGLQVAIAWSSPDFNLDLHVHARNHPTKSSTSVHAAEGQAVRIPARNDSYSIEVVNDSISPFAARKAVAYRGIIAVAPKESQNASRALLPDLVPLEPANLRLAIGTAVPGSAYVAAGHEVVDSGLSCYQEETAKTGATRCLRFDLGVANLGEGPLELRAPPLADVLSNAALDTKVPMRQRVYLSGGGSYDIALPEEATFHVSHGHMHYPALARARLTTVGNGGARRAVAPEGKTGFCFTDVRNLWFDFRGGTPRQYAFDDDCNFPETSDAPDGDALVSGISTGWADVYHWYLPDQYLDVSAVPDGVYELAVEVNVGTTGSGTRGIVEMAEGNNRVSIRIELRDNRVSILRS